MDIVSHAVAGAAIGTCFNMPIAGAVIGVLPDFVDITMLWKRYNEPKPLYRLTHSLEVAFAICILSMLFGFLHPYFLAFGLIWFSHIFLDFITHGAVWGPRWETEPDMVLWRTIEWEFLTRHGGAGLALLWQ